MRLCSVENRATLLVAMTASLAFAAPALAQSQAKGQPAPTSKAKDPNRIICQKVEETGSRVASAKICMTAQQWEEKRRGDREYLEDAQQRSIEPNSG